MKSYTWRNAINKSSLPPTTRHVLQTLSDHLNTNGGGAFPSQKMLAKETGLEERTVRRHLSIASRAGWIKVKKHGFSDRRSRTNEYFPQIPDMRIVDPPIEGHEDRGSSYQDDMRIVDPLKPPDMRIVDPPNYELINYEINTTSEGHRDTRSSCHPDSSNSDSDVIKIELLTREGNSFPIFESKQREWEETYPDVHVPGTLLEIRQWLRDNPKYRWPAEEMLSHVNGWMARVQNPLPPSNGYKGNGKQGGYYAQAK